MSSLRDLCLEELVGGLDRMRSNLQNPSLVKAVEVRSLVLGNYDKYLSELVRRSQLGLVGEDLARGYYLWQKEYRRRYP